MANSTYSTTVTCPINAMKEVAKNNDLQVIDTTGYTVKPGYVIYIGGSGFTGTMPAPSPGQRVYMRLASISSGSVVITCASGVTFDGTNNTATLAQAGDQCEFVYKSATQWYPIFNEGIALSSV